MKSEIKESAIGNGEFKSDGRVSDRLRGDRPDHDDRERSP
jgi:hypothetical protein